MVTAGSGGEGTSYSSGGGQGSGSSSYSGNQGAVPAYDTGFQRDDGWGREGAHNSNHLPGHGFLVLPVPVIGEGTAGVALVPQEIELTGDLAASGPRQIRYPHPSGLDETSGAFDAGQSPFNRQSSGRQRGRPGSFRPVLQRRELGHESLQRELGCL